MRALLTNNPATIYVILNGVKDLLTAGKHEILRPAQNDSIQVFDCRFNNKFINKKTCSVIPAPDYYIRGQAPAGIQKIRNWIPGQARNDIFISRHLAFELLNPILKIAVIITAALLLFDAHPAFSVKPPVFKGKVLDVSGKAVKGVEIFIYNTADTRRPADFISARTDEGGNFRMLIPAGKYRAVARLRKGEKYGPLMPGDKHSGEPVEIELEDGKELVMDFTVADIRDAARLIKRTREDYIKVTGRIIDKNGAPVKMYYVTAGRHSLNPTLNKGGQGGVVEGSDKFPDFISAWTDDEGRYALYLPEGRYYAGYSDKFPAQHHVYKELTVKPGMEHFDIVIEGENK